MAERRSRAWWRRTVGEWSASGESLGEFAGRRGLVASTLRWWASELRRSEPVPTATHGFVEVVGPGAAAGGGGAAVEPPTAMPEAVGVAVRVGRGVTLVLSTLPEPEYIARLASAFDEYRP